MIDFPGITSTSLGPTNYPISGVTPKDNQVDLLFSAITEKTGNGPKLAPGEAGTRQAMIKAMATFEELLILLSLLGKETRLAERNNALMALAEKAASSEAAAEKKMEAADKARMGAIANLVMCVTAATVSLVGAGVQIKQLNAGFSELKKQGLDMNSIKSAPSGDKTAAGAGDLSKESLINLRGGELNTLSTKVQIKGAIFQAFSQIVQGAGSMAQSWTGADSQTLQAEAEKLQAASEQIGILLQQSQSQESDFKDFMQTINNIIREFMSAQQKMAEAVAH